MSWPGGSALLLLSAVPCSLFLLTCRILLLFSRIGGVLSRLNSSIHGSHGCSLRNLRFLVTLAVSSLVFAAMNTAFMQRLRSSHLEHLLSCSALSIGISRPFTLWRFLFSPRYLVPIVESCPASGAPWSPAMHPIPRKGSGNNKNIEYNNKLPAIKLMSVGKENLDRSYIRYFATHFTLITALFDSFRQKAVIYLFSLLSKNDVHHWE